MKLWKVLGVAGLAGVAATGVVVARGERRRRTYEPDDVRARLHERYREAAAAEAHAPPEPQERGTAPGCLRGPWGRIRHPRRSR